MKQIISGVLCLTLLFTACSNSKDSNAENTETGGQALSNELQSNILSKGESNDGWILLFDGATTSGWRGFKKESFPDYGWHIKEGALMIDYSGTGEAGFAGDIITEKSFSNYELKMEWKISPGGNSGILLNVTESDQYQATWHTAHEIQVLDDFGYDDLHDYVPTLRQLSGAVYDLYCPYRAPSNPVGEWNQARVRLEEGRLQSWLNGVLVADVLLWNTDWEERVAKSKFSAFPDFGLAKEGHIGLQDHGEAVWYRNIKILEL